MTRVMARELAPYGWVVNSLSPGKIVDTRMAELTDAQVMELRGWGPDFADEYALKTIPMGRFTDTTEVAEAAFQMLQMPSYVNGANLDMTGGV
jgi:3-oxoacyl-[acyl-carrier protein] reductase